METPDTQHPTNLLPDSVSASSAPDTEASGTHNRHILKNADTVALLFQSPKAPKLPSDFPPVFFSSLSLIENALSAPAVYFSPVHRHPHLLHKQFLYSETLEM